MIEVKKRIVKIIREGRCNKCNNILIGDKDDIFWDLFCFSATCPVCKEERTIHDVTTTYFYEDGSSIEVKEGHS